MRASRCSPRGPSSAEGAPRTAGAIALFAFLALAPCASGCGSSAATPPVNSADAGGVSEAGTKVDASVTPVELGHVVTAGGGIGSLTSGNPFGTLPDAGDDATSTPPGDSGQQGDGPASVDATADALADGSSDSSEEPSATCESYTPPLCGATACDLRTNICCATLTPTFRCLARSSGQACASNEITIGCTQACECSGGQVCCGVLDTIAGIVESICEPVPAGGSCQPNPQTVTAASAQLCKTDAECQNGQPCISQTCVYNATLSVCGLQSQDPFDCMADMTDQ